MKKTKSVLGLCLLLFLGITACTSENDRNTTTISLSPAESTITPTEIVPTSTPGVGEDDSTVVWAVHFSADIAEEAQKEIKGLLKAKGLDINIEFLPTSYDCGREYVNWLDKQKEKNTAPDILSGCLWEHGTVDAAAFTSREFLPLNQCLKSEEGQPLRDAFANVEWEKYTINDEIYVIPVRSTKEKEPLIYLYVNDKYKVLFEEIFDGTYESLKMLCNADDANPVIALSGMGQTLLMTMGGYSKGFTSFNPKTKQFVDLTGQDEIKEILKTVYSDYQAGILVDAGTPEHLPENVSVYIHKGRLEPMEGFTEYVWTEDLFTTSAGVGYGILASSPRKELALQVLSACYSDPQIASLLNWGKMDASEWNRRTENLKSCAPSILTGFHPDLSIEEKNAAIQYDDDLDVLCRKMYLYSNGERTGINPDYEAYLDQFFSNSRDYGNLFDDLNKQFAEWAKKR